MAAQMIAVHNATMECFRRATFRDLSLEQYASFLKHGQKCAALFQRQMEALDRRRGKGQQKVTVEHVHVGPGGQAIVGNVDLSQGRKGHGAKAVEGQDPPPPPLDLRNDPVEVAPAPKKRVGRRGGS